MSLEDMHISQQLHTSNTTKKVLLDRFSSTVKTFRFFGVFQKKKT